jgi:rhodanese-related sulfurtransferase
MALAGSVLAENKVVAPESIPGATIVDAEGVLDLVEKFPRLVMVDARIRQDRKLGYIEGSVTLTDVDTTCESLARIIPQKSSPVLLYCNGLSCVRSTRSTQKALACGYTRLYWFRGGFEEWKAKNYPYLMY